jgi:hypothetical protein
MIVMNDANTMAMVWRSLDGDNTKHSQGKGGGDELIHGVVLQGENHATSPA